MKKFLLVSCLALSVTAFAHTEADPNHQEATPEEITSARTCFKELEELGCRHPKEDKQQFRSCMSNVFQNLSENCQVRMKRLYGNRK